MKVQKENYEEFLISLSRQELSKLFWTIATVLDLDLFNGTDFFEEDKPFLEDLWDSIAEAISPSVEQESEVVANV